MDTDHQTISYFQHITVADLHVQTENLRCKKIHSVLASMEASLFVTNLKTETYVCAHLHATPLKHTVTGFCNLYQLLGASSVQIICENS
jgi:hypothetical protein